MWGSEPAEKLTTRCESMSESPVFFFFSIGEAYDKERDQNVAIKRVPSQGAMYP